jgi:predicted ArsR family transcriptional regulator
LGRGIASHHLDRLAEEGLLEIDFRRLNDRRGPGAGRPAKVYRRASSEIAVNLPPRDYELAGRLLADAAEQSQRDGTPIGLAIDHAARKEGRRIGVETKGRIGRRTGVNPRRALVLDELESRGFEPTAGDDGVVVLHNCPFHRLAQTHTQLICGMNLCLLDSLLHEVDGTNLRAQLEPAPDSCCVRFHTTE